MALKFSENIATKKMTSLMLSSFEYRDTSLMRTITAVSSTEKLKFAVKYLLYMSRNFLRVHTKSPLILWVCKWDRLVKRFNHPSFASEIFSDGPPHATFLTLPRYSRQQCIMSRLRHQLHYTYALGLHRMQEIFSVKTIT